MCMYTYTKLQHLVRFPAGRHVRPRNPQGHLRPEGGEAAAEQLHHLPADGHQQGGVAARHERVRPRPPGVRPQVLHPPHGAHGQPGHRHQRLRDQRQGLPGGVRRGGVPRAVPRRLQRPGHRLLADGSASKISIILVSFINGSIFAPSLEAYLPPPL